MFWGLSESLDLYDEYMQAVKRETDESGNNTENCNDGNKVQSAPLNILLFGASDPRHVIKTLAKLYTHRKCTGPNPVLNFYVVEGCVELVARQMVLLAIALESSETFNLVSKVHLFMDAYGNSLLRPFTQQYLAAKAETLQRMVCDDDIMQQLAPMVNIQGLKYRERDGLENTFRFWMPNAGNVFNMQIYWCDRIRKLLGARYDYRDGAFDWDLNMTLKGREAKQICSQEYRYWRETGIAFTFPEYEYCKPNKTLAAGLIRNGERFVHRGYVGDIQTGPYCAFGLKTSDERMMHSMHGDNDYRATDVTERNLLEYFHELQTQTAYVHDVELSRKYGSVKLLMGERLTWNECDKNASRPYDKPWLSIEGVKLHFLSADDVLTMQNDSNAHWKKFFDVAFVAHNYFTFLKAGFAAILKDNALLILETKLLTVLRRDDCTAFETKLKDYAKSLKMASVINYNALNAKNSILKFRKVMEQL